MLIAFFLIKALSFLPIKWLRKLGDFLGIVGYKLAVSRRNIGMKNLSLCFPEMSNKKKQAIIRKHFKYLLTSIIEYGFVFYANANKIKQLVTIKNVEYIEKIYGEKPIIILCPHFVGLELAALRLSIDYVACSLVSSQKNKKLTEKLKNARIRFMKEKGGVLFTRTEGIWPIIRKLRDDKLNFYYLPDQDFGEKDSIFVPFFSYKTAATVNILPKIVTICKGVVIPMVVYRTSNGYTIEFSEPFIDYPTANLENDIIRMNQAIEKEVLGHIHDYYWLHKRFKTQQGIKDRGLLYK